MKREGERGEELRKKRSSKKDTHSKKYCTDLKERVQAILLCTDSEEKTAQFSRRESTVRTCTIVHRNRGEDNYRPY